jgi:hypothetical protein
VVGARLRVAGVTGVRLALAAWPLPLAGRCRWLNCGRCTSEENCCVVVACGNDRHIRGYTTEENYDIAPFAVFLVRCVLRCGYPLSSAEGGAFRLGVAQLGAAQRRRGGRRGGNDPAPANFAQLLGGRGPLGLPGGPNGPKNGLLWPTQANEISSRRVDRGR